MGDITQKGLGVYGGRGLTLVSEVSLREKEISVYRTGDSTDHVDYDRAISVDTRAYTDAKEWLPQTGLEQINVERDLFEGEEPGEAIIDLLMSNRFTFSQVSGYTISAFREESRKDKRGESVVGGQATESMSYVFTCIHVESFLATVYDGTVNLRAAVMMCGHDELHDYMDEFESSQGMSFYRYHATEACREDESGLSVIGHQGEYRQGQLIAESSYNE